MLRLLLALVVVLLLALAAVRLYPRDVAKARRQAAAETAAPRDGGRVRTIDTGGSPATINREIREIKRDVERTLKNADDKRLRSLDEAARTQ